MAKIVAPSTITTGQIGEMQKMMGAALCKSELQRGPVQMIIEMQGDALIAEWVATLQKRVDDAASNNYLFVRRVKVDRNRTPQAVVDLIGREHGGGWKPGYDVDPEVVNTMPHGEGEEVEVFFFRLVGWRSISISYRNLQKEYKSRGLKPADPYSLAQVNIDDPGFADTCPNVTHWKNTGGEWCFALFGHWVRGRNVGIDRDRQMANPTSRGTARGWRSDHWWFAGVRK